MPAKKSGGRSPRAVKSRAKKSGGKRRLSIRQQRLLDGITKKVTPMKAALEAGYSQRSAEHAGELLDTIAMREAMSRLLASPEKIAKRINEGLDAMETKFFQFEGRVSDKRNVVAWSERRMYADLAAELKGLKPSQKLEVGGQITQKVIVEFTDVAAQESA